MREAKLELSRLTSRQIRKLLGCWQIKLYQAKKYMSSFTIWSWLEISQIYNCHSILLCSNSSSLATILDVLEVNDNMALRADPSDSSKERAAGGASTLAGLQSYWDVEECPPRTEWGKWWDLFVSAVNAKYSISLPDLPRTVTEQQPQRHLSTILTNKQLKERE